MPEAPHQFALVYLVSGALAGAARSATVSGSSSTPAPSCTAALATRCRTGAPPCATRSPCRCHRNQLRQVARRDRAYHGGMKLPPGLASWLRARGRAHERRVAEHERLMSEVDIAPRIGRRVRIPPPPGGWQQGRGKRPSASRAKNHG